MASPWESIIYITLHYKLAYILQPLAAIDATETVA